ncbi:MAG: hypothetical protein ABW019_04370, partial [Chitinophagaceae bacterium]
FALFTTAVSAQQGRIADHRRIQKGFATGQLSRGEKFKLQQHNLQYNQAKRKAFRDGRLSPLEKRKLYTMKRHNRQETFRFKHNARRRVI